MYIMQYTLYIIMLNVYYMYKPACATQSNITVLYINTTSKMAVNSTEARITIGIFGSSLLKWFMTIDENML